MSPIAINFALLPDKKLVLMILDGNEDAGVHFVYVRYDKDIDYQILRYYDDLRFKDDLTNYLYIQIKGSNGDWSPLRSFQWRCSLRTWFNSVASHLFLEKKKVLIGLGDVSTSIDTPEGETYAGRLVQDEKKNAKLVMLMEAINRLKNEDYRFILLKEIEGYSAKEIAQLLGKKRIEENRVKKRPSGALITPNADYVYMIKNRALKDVKVIVEQVRKEWYGHKR